MTTWELTDSPTTRAGVAPARPQLRSLIGGKGSAIRAFPFAGLVVAILIAGMIGLLALNVHLETQAFELSKAQRKAATLALEVSDKQAQVYAKSGPEQLAGAASALGMVPNTYPAFVDLRTGQIIGTPKAVTGNEMPALKVPAAPVPVADATTPVQTHVQPWFDLGTTVPAAASPSPSPTAKATATASAKATTTAKATATASAKATTTVKATATASAKATTKATATTTAKP